MNASQQVKEFAKRNGMTVCGKHGLPMLSKKFNGGAMFIECFDSYPEALSFITKAQNAYTNNGTATPWSKPNFK